MQYRHLKYPQKIILILLLILFLLGLPNKIVTAQSPEDEHLAVIFIIDDSGSMKANDPTNLRFTASQLFVSLLDHGDAVAALRFSTTVTPITNNIEIITNQDVKTKLVEKLKPANPDGYTDVKAAFEEAFRMKAAFVEDNYKVVVIFLTDGNPEIPLLYSSYEQESLDVARKLNVPILSVALTSDGQTPFLNHLANETGGQVILATSASDLLDIYLQILGNLKDRTVIGVGNTNSPDILSLPLDPALMPYVDRVSFVVSKTNNTRVRLIAPGGQVISLDDPNLEFAIQDQRFSVFTLQQPASGDWDIELNGTGEVQVRAILNSRLRVNLVTPESSFESGQPLPLVVKLTEEQISQAPITIIGQASFSAFITRPDGTQESLDQFYDDGTHGDETAGDGLFSRLYVNTIQSGTYQIEIQGFKGAVPVVQQVLLQGINFPSLILTEPLLNTYDIRANTIPLNIQLAGATVNELDSGSFIALITKPGGDIERLELQNSGSNYSGNYLPTEDGIYTIRFEPIDTTYQGLPYHHLLDISFEVNVIPTILIESVQVGLNGLISSETPRFEFSQAQQGIPLLISISSSSNISEQVKIRLADLPGFTLKENAELTVGANGITDLTIHLIADPALQAREFQGKIIFSTSEDVDLIEGIILIDLEVYVPTIKLISVNPSIIPTGTCIDPMDIHLMLDIESSSSKNEEIHFFIEEFPGTTLRQEKIIIQPGLNQIDLIVQQDDSIFSAGDYIFKLFMNNVRPGLKVIGDSSIPVHVKINPIWENCQRPMIILGTALFLGVILIVMLIRKSIRNNTPPKVTGTLIYWSESTPNITNSIDLTELNKTEVIIGKSSSSDIQILDENIQDQHARILVERDAKNELNFILRPIASVRKGYREYTNDLTLEEEVLYQMGNQIFRFIRDINL